MFCLTRWIQNAQTTNPNRLGLALKIDTRTQKIHLLAGDDKNLSDYESVINILIPNDKHVHISY